MRPQPSAGSGRQGPHSDSEELDSGNERDQVSESSEEELAPLLASKAGKIREVDGGGLQIQLECSVNSAERGLTAVLMSKAFRHIRTQSSSKFQHTVVTCKTALKHGFMRKGPMGVGVRLDAEYQVSSPVGGPQEGAMKITAVRHVTGMVRIT